MGAYTGPERAVPTATTEPPRCPYRVPNRSPAPITVLLSVIACAHPQTSSRKLSVDGELATQLVAWDTVRRRAESNLLTIPLPSIALRESPTVNDGFQAVTVVALPRLSPHFSTVTTSWPTICERRGVLPDDVFNYAMAWCQYARDGKGDLEHVIARIRRRILRKLSSRRTK